MAVGRVLLAKAGVAKERLITGGRVTEARGVAKERKRTGGRFVCASGVAGDCKTTVGGVGGAGGAAKECSQPMGRIVDPAGDEAEKRTITLSGVAAGIASVGCRGNPESFRGR